MAENTGCDLQSRKMSEFSKTEHARKTPEGTANEGQRTGAVRISKAKIQTNFLYGFLDWL